MSEVLTDEGWIGLLKVMTSVTEPGGSTAPSAIELDTTTGGTSSVWKVKLSGVSVVPWRFSRPLIETLWTPSEVVLKEKTTRDHSTGR